MIESGKPRAAVAGVPGLGEFVVLVAALMALTALGHDSMLAALPDIGRSLDVVNINHTQWVIATYLMGFGIAQLFFGPLSDRFGRKPVLVAGLVLFVLMSIVASLATSFTILIAARVMQGVAAAASRSITVTMVRDLYSGSEMARVMALTFIVFIGMPIVAPNLGQAIILVADWRWIFVVMAVYALGLAFWLIRRMPETLHPEYRRTLLPKDIWASLVIVMTERFSVGYTLAMMCLLGGNLGFINSSQEIIGEEYGHPASFSLIFSIVFGGVAVASLMNAVVVPRFGPRRVAHVGLLGYIVAGVLHVLFNLSGHESLWTFVAWVTVTMSFFGLAVSNVGSIAMERLGHVAGMASSAQGFFVSIGSAIIGIVIGQFFKGTTLPVDIGFVVVGLVGLVVLFITEQGRLFGTSMPPQNAAALSAVE